MRGWIGVDLDGTLAEYHGWPSDGSIGEPIPAMVERVKAWLEQGVDVRIFTARVSHDGTPKRRAEADVAYCAICAWCSKVFGRSLLITNVKDYAMVELWDDRAVQVIPNTGRRADGL